MFSRGSDGGSKSLQEFLDDSRGSATSQPTGTGPVNTQSAPQDPVAAQIAQVSPQAAAGNGSRQLPLARSAQSQKTRDSANRTVQRDDGVSVIGRDLAILGNDLKIVSRGKIQIEGEVRGDVYGHEILIGDQGRVAGTVSATQIVVRGAVQGVVRGKDVVLASTANVDADVHHASLSLEQGAVFEGRSRRPENVETLVPDLDSLSAEDPASASDGAQSRTPSHLLAAE